MYELLEQFAEPTRRIELSENQLRMILASLSAEGYAPLRGILPIQDEHIVASELQKKPIDNTFVGPYVLEVNDSLVYYPGGRMLYAKDPEFKKERGAELKAILDTAHYWDLPLPGHPVQGTP